MKAREQKNFIFMPEEVLKKFFDFFGRSSGKSGSEMKKREHITPPSA
jgi:hypothetical protein